MTVVSKKDEKIAHILSLLDENFSNDDYLLKIREVYPKDWDKAERNFISHERKTKPGKSHPCPNPNQYFINALNVFRKKNRG